MAEGNWAGHHCKVCYEQAMKEKARLDALLRAKRNRQLVEPSPRPEPPAPVKKVPSPLLNGCVFAKSCALPDGIINHSNANGFVPVESLSQYGAYAVLGMGTAVSNAGAALEWIGGSGSAIELAKRLGGSLSTLAPPNVKIIIGMVLPNTTSPDSAFYTSEQYAQLSEGNTRVRVNVKHLPDGSVSVYGFYTGTKREWQRVPVIAAQARGAQLVADMGGGIEVIWTPAADPNKVLGIPALEGASLKPAVWVYPPGEKADQILINPVHPPDYQDAIIWFPSQPQVAPIYLSINVRGGGDIKYHKPPKELSAFPDAKPAKDKSSIQGGGGKRRRWKDSKGRIYEWDSQHGKVEIYSPQGTIHLGEFDPETGEQTKPAKPGRTTPK
ncbi:MULTISPECIES: colicin E3/pyocin S6 family cytotoxin [unclassified Pseudomonas]|uniref:colicin E3/pyocin S6 family cytotoxin n=1 Tax=unclassified Pseudomonas TaxID=196821 RepID=UPI002AC9C06E|nr:MULTISPECIES: colicin E3/pyocin S6 family cytotoxin [unclassified Pseudomonas]MEB0047052.1 colicin E3/pyocin S6 family cytotoxin [Pseudomonas sp. Dout3]MEB0097796.1 colicin E3/pyocin S6 family cytotoxin [Pseudomonas sp. DC1.2]WPX57189.1 colicin E3/pyocin S6 family cytotoxin [Pseudomonas sp. DC1.2]